MDKRPGYEIARETVNRMAHELGLEIKAEFVPFSQSANAKPAGGRVDPWQSLNWKVSLECKGRPVLESCYSQGIAHCPAHRAPATRFDKWQRARAIALEIESGKIALGFNGPHLSARPIPAPEIADVLSALALDSSALDSATFADWASEHGYDTDSRSAESTYRQCLAIALALRAAIGESALARLRDAAGQM